tara:strand:+ start:434 stop:1369 length:936 start_codon:yes stop_codon:yes gene_type:complete
LAELLLNKGYEVHGIVRRTANENKFSKYSRINHILKDLNIHIASLESYASLFDVINKTKPNELYHLAAQSFVKDSFEDEFSTLNSNINGTHYILSAIKTISPETKFYFAGSSEMFGKTSILPQNENTPFHPRSPYAISKVTGFDLTRNYREAYNIFAVSGILFNHESPRRGFEFVTRKISLSVAKIKNKLQNELVLGNLNSKRDWGYAKDYVEAMWLMLQKNDPEDYVIGTGVTKSIEDFVKLAFSHVNLNYLDYVKFDEKFLRPAEVDHLIADSAKAKKKLKWETSVNFESLVEMMVESDLKMLKNTNQY